MMIMAESTKDGIEISIKGTGAETLEELGALVLSIAENVCEKTEMSESEALEFVKHAVDLYICFARATERKEGEENKC